MSLLHCCIPGNKSNFVGMAISLGLGCTPAILHTGPPCPLNLGCENFPMAVACVEVKPHSPGLCRLPRRSLTQPRHLPTPVPPAPLEMQGMGRAFPLYFKPHSLGRWDSRLGSILPWQQGHPRLAQLSENSIDSKGFQ